ALLARVGIDQTTRRAAARDDQIAVDAREPDAGRAMAPERREKIGRDLSREHHLRELERVIVRDAPPGDLRALDSETLGEVGELRAAAVDDDEADSHLIEERDVLGDAVEDVLLL